MSAAIFASGQVGEDAPCLIGVYDSMEAAKANAPKWCGIVIADFDTRKIIEREYRANGFTEMQPSNEPTA